MYRIVRTYVTVIMADRVLFFFLATLVYEANSQLCGCGCPGPLYPGPIAPQLAPGMPCMGPIVGPPPLIAEPCLTPQVLPAPPIIAPPQTFYPAPPIIAQPCPNVVAATVIDNTVSNSLANAIQLLIVSNLIENTLNAGLLPGNIVNLCDTVINPLPCVDFAEVMPLKQNLMPTCLCEQTPIFETVGPMCGYEVPLYPNFVIPEPIQPIYPPAIPTMAPVTAEVLFPSAIPAQLTCNFGYMNTNVPCVSVNVEPLQSFDNCNPFFNNGYFY